MVTMTTTVGVRELKNALSRYVRLAKGGDRVVVLERGRPVAVLSPVDRPEGPLSVATHLAGLAARDLVTLPDRVRPRRVARSPKVDLSGAIGDDRDERG